MGTWIDGETALGDGTGVDQGYEDEEGGCRREEVRMFDASVDELCFHCSIDFFLSYDSITTKSWLFSSPSMVL